MLAHTVRTVISQLQKFANSKVFEIDFEAKEQDSLFKVTISKQKISIKILKGSMEILQEIQKIEHISFPNVLIPVRFKEYRELGETIETPLKFETQIFIEVFNVLKRKVHFYINAQDSTYLCYYINNKVYIVEETDTEVVVRETNLYKFYRSFGEYSITMFSPMSGRTDQTLFLKGKQTMAEKANKSFLEIKE